MTDKPRDSIQDARENISLLIGLSQALAMPCWVWWTKFGTAGEMFFGARLMCLGWLLVPVFPMCVMPCDPRPVYYFWIATSVLMVIHRIRHRMLRRRGYRPHSQFMGFSRLAWLWRNDCHSTSEAVWTSGIGLILAGPFPPLGWYLVWAGLAMAVSTGYAAEQQRSMLRRVLDAKREQEWLQEQIKRMGE